MINVTIDTCIWLELLKVDFNNEDNYLEELCFWIENRYLNHVVPINIIDEWSRHKLNYQRIIADYFKKKETDQINLFKNNKELSSTYQPQIIKDIVQSRIERIDLILNTFSEKIPLDDSILKEAAERNLKTLAPNHKKDSFRDTVNILSLISYLKNKSHTNSIFTTLNYDDFSLSPGKKYDLHDQLISDFEAVHLMYIYFDELENFGTRFFNQLRKDPSLPNFQDYLRDKKDKAEAKELAGKKEIIVPTIETPDIDYLDNIGYIDKILAKKNRTQVDEEIIKLLISRHNSYELYFLRNVGNNGMV